MLKLLAHDPVIVKALIALYSTPLFNVLGLRHIEYLPGTYEHAPLRLGE